MIPALVTRGLNVATPFFIVTAGLAMPAPPAGAIAALITRGLNVANPYYIATAGLSMPALPPVGSGRFLALLGVGL